MRFRVGVRLDVTQGEPALTGRKRDGTDAVGNAQLVQDARHVVLDRLLADVEELPDLAVALPSGDQTEDVELPRGQRVGRRAVGVSGALPEALHDPVDEIGPPDHLGTQGILAIGDLADHRHELGWLRDGGDVTCGADLDGPEDARVVVLAPDDHDPGGGGLLDESLGGGTGFGFLQLDIEDEHVGSVVPGHRERVVGRADLRRPPPCRPRHRGRRGSRDRRGSWVRR